MGLINFLKGKKEKPTLMQDIKKASGWITEALKSSGYSVDFTIDSLREIDRFFAENLDDELHTPIKNGLLSQHMGKRLFAIGAYIGEVLINAYGGVWITDDKDKYGELNISIRLSNGSVVWPVQRIMKRCKEGQENDIYLYAKSLTE